MKQRTISNQIAMAWSKSPLIIRSVLTGFSVSAIGITAWSIMLSGIAAPWSILPMIIALWVYLKFFSGRWGSKKSIEIRKLNFRATRLSASVWKWGIGAALLFVI